MPVVVECALALRIVECLQPAFSFESVDCLAGPIGDGTRAEQRSQPESRPPDAGVTVTSRGSSQWG